MVPAKFVQTQYGGERNSESLGAPIGSERLRKAFMNGLEVLERLKGVRLLQGFRGSAPVDMDRLAEVVVRLSELAADHAEHIEEIDVNPLICAADRIIAVDALIVRKAGSYEESKTGVEQ